jgi:hypothetical protein
MVEETAYFKAAGRQIGKRREREGKERERGREGEREGENGQES